MVELEGAARRQFRTQMMSLSINGVAMNEAPNNDSNFGATDMGEGISEGETGELGKTLSNSCTLKTRSLQP